MKLEWKQAILICFKKFYVLNIIWIIALFVSLPASAASEYKRNDAVTVSGQTDFDNQCTWTTPYSFMDGSITYECFPMITEDGTRWYAGVIPRQYQYYRKAFYGSTVTFNGTYQGTTDDGIPVFCPSSVLVGEKGEVVEVDVKSYLWNQNVWDEDDENPNFQAFYNIYCEAVQGRSQLTVLSIAEDGSYLKIDTNPTDVPQSSIAGTIVVESSHQPYANECIQILNRSLGLPSWVYNEMGDTRAIDGRIKETFDKVTVTWTYHPDSGLEVMYRQNS